MPEETPPPQPIEIKPDLNQIIETRYHTCSEVAFHSCLNYRRLIWHLQRGNIKSHKPKGGNQYLILGKDFLDWFFNRIESAFDNPDILVKLDKLDTTKKGKSDGKKNNTK